MKSAIHPTDYQLTVFQDLNNGVSFLTRSTAKADDTIVWEDGNTYPVVKVHISSASHPFFTGQEKLMDIEGRVDKFKARQDAAEAKRLANVERKAKPSTKKAPKDIVVSKKIAGLKSERTAQSKPKPAVRPSKPATDK